jgi:hypothetical protein
VEIEDVGDRDFDRIGEWIVLIFHISAPNYPIVFPELRRCMNWEDVWLARLPL